MKTVTRNAPRLALGLILTLSALGYFLDLAPRPPLPPPAAQFALALAVSGYLMTLVKVVELAAGLLLLSGRAVPLAVVMVTPVVVNIFLFHAFLARDGLGIAVVLMVLLGVLVRQSWAALRPLLGERRPEPAGRGDRLAAAGQA